MNQNETLNVQQIAADKCSIKECKECPHLLLEGGNPTCMITIEDSPLDCRLITTSG